MNDPTKQLPPGWEKTRANYEKLGLGQIARQLIPAGKSLTQAAGGTVVLLAKGQPIQRTEEQASACLAICQGCERWNAYHQVCGICLCVTRWKKQLAASPCPLNKWPD